MGLHSFFTDWFHCLDAFVILASFIVDVLSHGVLEEIASLVIILRLFRFVKIVEELSVGAAERVRNSQPLIARLHAPRLTYELLRSSKTSRRSSKGWSLKTPTSRLRSKLSETRERKHSNERQPLAAVRSQGLTNSDVRCVSLATATAMPAVSPPQHTK